ncbi:AraC family transcriptional regulator [Marinobacter salicampi]|uniref:AraC family transcriptional regulator n=1 Tax=Marinobacter salicampi TaxID=435907 RepID=UPI0014084D8C|nr:AraC family transcriptional regulator [Marinobacter salicampi]
MANRSSGKDRPMPGLFLVPGAYMRVLADTVRKLGHNERVLYQGLTIGPEDLRTDDSRVLVTDAMVMADRAVALAGHQGLSFMLARELRVTIHGTLGFAALTSPTMADALDSVRRYLQLRVPFLSITLRETEDAVLVQLKPEYSARSLDPFLAETVSATLMMLADQLVDRDSAEAEGCELVNGKFPGMAVRLTAPEPGYYREFASQLPVPFEYGCDTEMMMFPLALLRARMRLADAEASEMARQQCELELQKALKDQGDITFAIRNMLQVMPGPLPSLEAMAERFYVSSRTLKRRLSERNTSYRELVESVLKDRAIQLLRYTNRSVSEIAYELGYADLSNFSRAFRKWTGKSASEFRDDGSDPAPEVGP